MTVNALTRQSAAMSTYTAPGNGAVPRVMTDHLTASGLSVLSFGAPRDGVTDAAPYIQKAVDAQVAAGGGIVYLPPGKYLIGSTIKVCKPGAAAEQVQLGVHLIGAGRGATTLIRKAGWTGPLVNFGRTDADGDIGIMRGCGIHDLTMRCPTSLVDGLDYTSAHLKFYDVQAAAVSRLLFEEGPCDIYCRNLAQSEFSYIESFRAYTPADVSGKHAVVFEAGSNVCGDVFFWGCNFRVGHGHTSYVTHSTVLLRAGDGIWFDGCHLQGGKQTILIDGTYAANKLCGGLKVSNCWLDLVDGLGTWGYWGNDQNGNAKTAYEYVVDQITAYSGSYYRCHTRHIATTSAGFDASKFTVISGPNLENMPFDSSHVTIQGSAASAVHNITIVNTTFMAGSAGYRRGVTVLAGARLEALRIDGCLFTGHAREAIVMQTSDNTICSQVDITNNRIQNIQRSNSASSTQVRSAMYFGGVSDLTVKGNNFNSTGVNHGIVLNAGVKFGVVSENKFYIPDLYITNTVADPSKIVASAPENQGKYIEYDNHFWIA